MIKTVLFFSAILFFTITVSAQNLTVSSGTTLTLTAGTIFSVDSLVLIPSTDFSLSNTINKTTAVMHSAPYPYIARVYRFNGTGNAFTGSIQVNYKDGAELNGIPENALSLNIHDGSSWKGYTATTRDGTQNFVLTNGLSSVTLNELTLADAAFPLPLNWLSFTAVKNNDQTVLLHWITAQEQNTKNFIIQHSTDGVSWTATGTLPATGSIGNGNYNFIHTTPAIGINYYRILQTDINNRFSYSEIRTVNFASTTSFIILNNPATGGTVSVQVNMPTVLSIYAADGKLVWTAKVNTGRSQVNISGFAKGIYLMVDTERTAQKFIIQ